MKKILLLFFILSQLSLASTFKYYKEATIESCANKLNELSKTYKIISYKMIPAHFIKNYRGNYGEVLNYNMIIEVEDKIKEEK